MIREPRRLDLSLSLRREPVTLALLTGLAIVLFLAVTGLSRLYEAQQESLAEDWSAQGLTSLNGRQFADAIIDFRTALLYDRDNDSYQLSLAQALLGQGRTDEAYNYLINQWDRQPENGVVNLELARIAVKRKQMEQALRYYHNAIYATWPGNQESERQNARLELVDYLLGINAKTQAESELIALEANVGDDAGQQTQLGTQFLRVPDYNRALAAFRASLKLQSNNPAADAGAGMAAFQLGQYPAAEADLRTAVANAPDDAASAQQLRMTEAVLRIDPYRQRISDSERNQAVISAFSTAGERLKSCSPAGAPGTAAAGKPAAAPDLEQSWEQNWSRLKPQITMRGLRQNPDLANEAMNLAFQIERKTNGICGDTSEADKALLLIASQREEN
jgi:tetratricopeptide (TPR) repeat protein